MPNESADYVCVGYREGVIVIEDLIFMDISLYNLPRLQETFANIAGP
jgi:hypothetical protein